MLKGKDKEKVNKKIKYKQEKKDQVTRKSKMKQVTR